jgi:hypothetical protein
VLAFAAKTTHLPPAILLMGPTTSGKTAVAMALADRFPVELISVDSAQVFVDMNLGTAKPDPATLARYPHRLIDLITPEQSYSAARFCADALAAMAEITAAGKVPLLVGGTILYFRALLQGLAELPQPTRRCAPKSTPRQPCTAGRRSTPAWPASTRPRRPACTRPTASACSAPWKSAAERPPDVRTTGRKREHEAALRLPVDRPAALRPQRAARTHCPPLR